MSEDKKEDMDMDGLFDDAGAVEETASEFTNDSEDKGAESVEETESESVEELSEDLPEVSAKNSESGVAVQGNGIDFGMLSSLPGVVVGDTGIEVSRFPVERIKFSKGQIS